MKKLFVTLPFLLLFAVAGFTQATAVVHLEQLKSEAGSVKTEFANTKRAANTLIKQLSLTNGQANVSMFETQVTLGLNRAVDGIDNMYYYLSEALSASAQGFNPANLQNSIANLSLERDMAQDLVPQIVGSIQAGNKQLALSQLAEFNNKLSLATKFCNQTISRAEAALQVIRPYQVCIRLVDGNGNPTTTSDLFGYYAYNTATNQYYYPENQEGTCFSLAKGTYTFDAYDGYWSGTGSRTVTLKRSLENADGIILVDLILWSE